MTIITVADRRSFADPRNADHHMISIEPWTVSLLRTIGRTEILLFAQVLDFDNNVAEYHGLDGTEYPAEDDALLAAWNAGLVGFEVSRPVATTKEER